MSRKSRVWFYHGMILDGLFCPFCDRFRRARIIRDLYFWRAHFVCGHVRSNVGLTMPYEELERKGYINQKGTPDPRYLAKVKQEWLDFFERRKAIKGQARAEELFASKQIMH